MLLSCRNHHHTDKRRKLPEQTLRLLKCPWTAQSLSAQKPSTQDEPLLSTMDIVSVKRSSSGFPEHCSSHCESQRIFPSEERLSHLLMGVSTGAPPDALARRGLLSPRQTLGGYTATARVPGCWAASPGSLVGLSCAQRPPACMGASGQGGRGRRGEESSVLTTEDAPPAVSVGGPAGLIRGAPPPARPRVGGSWARTTGREGTTRKLGLKTHKPAPQAASRGCCLEATPDREEMGPGQERGPHPAQCPTPACGLQGAWGGSNRGAETSTKDTRKLAT